MLSFISSAVEYSHWKKSISVVSAGSYAMVVIPPQTNVHQTLRFADDDHKLWGEIRSKCLRHTMRTLLPRGSRGSGEAERYLWVRLHYYCSGECQVVRKLEKFLHIVNQHLARIRLDFRNGKRHLCNRTYWRILFSKQVHSFSFIIYLLLLFPTPLLPRYCH